LGIGKKHGATANGKRTPEYRTWISMRHRCINKAHKDYHHYGGRGITVCDRWVDSFENFLADMGERPDGYSLDRIDNSKGYSPDNCRWATKIQQANNRRPKKTAPMYTMDSETKTLAEWAKDPRCFVRYQTLYQRTVYQKLDIAEAMRPPKKKRL